MAITDRLRSVASRAGRALLSFSASATPAVPGFEPRSRDGGNRDQTVGRQINSQDALFGRISYAAGPAQTRYSSYPERGLEPTTIWNLQVQRNNGYPQLWCELAEGVLERDGHLGGIAETRRHSVLDKPLRFHPALRDDLSASLQGLIERAVDRIDSFDQTIEDLLYAPAFGWASSEMVWVRDQRVRLKLPNGKTTTVLMHLPRTIEWVHQKHFRFDRDTDEPYIWISGDGQSLPENKFVFHVGSGAGLVERRGFLSSCIWLSAAKRWSERDWLVYAKLFGIPNIMGKYSDGKEEYEKHRTEYQKLLKDWGEGIPVILPEDLVVEVTRDPGGRSNDVHGAIIGWANGEMSKRVHGSTLTVEIGNQGAYAAADTHRDAPYMRSRADARKLAGTLRRDIYTAILRVNRYRLATALGETPDDIMERVPRCSWRIEREMTPMDRQKVYEGAVNELGVDVDEEQYRDEMGMDAPRPGGQRLRGKPIPVGSGGLAPSIEASEDGAEPPAKPAPAPPAKSTPSDRDSDDEE
jgi:phage gp29-like protein